MRKYTAASFVCLLAAALLLVSCNRKPAVSSGKEAVKASESMPSVEEKVGYLTAQAEAFYNSKEFQQAIDIAQHVLRNLDKDSAEAKSLLERASQALKQAAGEAVGEAKKKLEEGLGGVLGGK